MSTDEIPFWRRKTLAEMNEQEWESLCDGCGRCCLVKLEEDLEDAAHDPAKPPPNPRIFYTDLGCRLLDGQSCRCRDYPNRSDLVPDCVRLTPADMGELGWLPPTCGYRLVHEGQDLKWWHHLVSGDPETVHTAGISVRGRVVADEDAVPNEDYEDHIVDWPLRWPRGAKRRASSR